MKKILISHADNLQNDCLTIWVKYDADKSGFLDQKGNIYDHLKKNNFIYSLSFTVFVNFIYPPPPRIQKSLPVRKKILR